jgi:hypothetical protein
MGGAAPDGDGRGADYRTGRLAVAAALTLTVIFLVVINTLRREPVDGVVLASLLGAIVTVLGIEVAGRLRR